jgi:hypothetical protein
MSNKTFVQAYQMAPTYIPNSLAKKPLAVRQSLGPVDRSMANVETEGGETVFLPDKEGLPAHYRIHGARHSEGGVPMNIPPDSFVFSDTRSMRIKDQDLLKEFGMPANKKGFTPAEIAKRYDINKFRRILQDPDSDKLQIQTAEYNIANFQVKLGKLALIQESMKGFPGGIPLVAMPYLAKYNIDPEMVLPTNLPSGGGNEMPQQMPMARYGGGLQMFQPGGQATAALTPEQQAELDSLPSRRDVRRAEKKAKREAERKYLIDYYTQLLSGVVADTTATADEKADLSTGVFYRQDSNGNPYYVDGRGIRVKSFDTSYYGPNNLPTAKDGERIIEKNGKRYRVTTTVKKGTKIDQSKVKAKDKAINSGDIYLENGKYYQIGAYDETKPIRATKSGQQIDPAQFDQNKARATEILARLEKDGAAVYHNTPFTVGNETRNPGWEIKSSARGKMNTEEKEFLTDFFSVGKNSGQIGAGTPELNVSLQGAGDSGFYGFTNPDFYEYRFWKARNQDKGSGDWDKLSTEDKKKNRKNMLYNLGFDTNDAHITANIDNPDKLYSKDFVSGRKVAKLNRTIKDADGKEYSNLGFADAVESYFTDADFRPGLGSDKKLGLEHADAFTYDKPVTEVLPGDEEVTTEKEILDKENPNYRRSGAYAPWWLQDIVKISGAAYDLFDINKYKPYKPTYSPYVPQPTFYDPNREIAALQETAGIATDATRGMGASAQSLGARLASIQGKAAESIANTMGKYNNLNVGVANEFAYKKADIMNEASLKNQMFTKQYIDEFNTLNQNYDNAKRMARGNLRQSYIDGITNRAQAQVLNDLYPNYQIDPSTGGFMTFNRGTDMVADENAGQTSMSRQNADAFYNWWKAEHPDLDADQATSIWTATSRMKPQTMTPQQNYYNAYSNVLNSNQAVEDPGPGNYYLNQRKGGPVPFTYTVGYSR